MRTSRNGPTRASAAPDTCADTHKRRIGDNPDAHTIHTAHTAYT
ncbi:hypothetical protein CBM2609_B120219 [Cupriavidus taiwanensis]|nr:hypothetical protein CBM2604_B130218 [Cupriavidus taiwanensis]SOZ31260.1 hypothetical protein CBM2609_B120219 [Cupriavidus taiwanensis]SOZ47337.1 hypothetical protein CBM2610_B100219 [Cupriavidus taiwanensis]